MEMMTILKWDTMRRRRRRRAPYANLPPALQDLREISLQGCPPIRTERSTSKRTNRNPLGVIHLDYYSEIEPELRRLLHYYTSWSSMQDDEGTSPSFTPNAGLNRYPTASFTARLLTQALSNLVTGNDQLISNLWETYLNLPEDQVVIMSELLYFSEIGF